MLAVSRRRVGNPGGGVKLLAMVGCGFEGVGVDVGTGAGGGGGGGVGGGVGAVCGDGGSSWSGGRLGDGGSSWSGGRLRIRFDWRCPARMMAEE